MPTAEDVKKRVAKFSKLSAKLAEAKKPAEARRYRKLAKREQRRGRLVAAQIKRLKKPEAAPAAEAPAAEAKS